MKPSLTKFIKTAVTVNLLPIAFLSCNRHEVYLSKQIEEVSVTYTVPLYKPSQEWLGYIVSYTAPDGGIATDTISYENVISGKVSLVSVTDKYPIDRQDGRAFWVRNGHFTVIPDSCSVRVRIMYSSDVDMPDRIDLIVPQPGMTAVVRHWDGTLCSVIGEGLDCNVVSLRTGMNLFKSIFEGEYYSTITFFPSVQITGGRH